jgi:hypothetical protein
MGLFCDLDIIRRVRLSADRLAESPASGGRQPWRREAAAIDSRARARLPEPSRHAAVAVVSRSRLVGIRSPWEIIDQKRERETSLLGILKTIALSSDQSIGFPSSQHRISHNREIDQTTARN